MMGPLGPSAHELWANARWVARRAYHCSPWRFVSLLATSLVNAAVPATIALATGTLAADLESASLASEQGAERLAFWLAIIIPVFFVRSATGTLHSLVREQLGIRLHWSLSRDLLQHSAQLDLDFLEDPRSQDMLSLVNRAPGAHATRFLMSMIEIATAVVKVVSLLGLLAVLQPWSLPVLVVAGLPLLVLELRTSAGRHLVEQLNARRRRWTAYCLAQFTNAERAPSAQLLNLLPLMEKRFEEMRTEITASLERIHRTRAIGRLIAVAIYFAAFTAVVVFIGRWDGGPSLSLGAMTTFAMTALFLQSSLNGLFTSTGVAVERALFLTQIAAFLRIESTTARKDGFTPQSVRGSIALHGVTFAYPGRPPALQDVTLEIQPGETVAIVGHNGSGKTTLAKLLVRLYDPARGEIRIDDVEISRWSTAALRENIAMVFQRPVRYEATVTENIAIGAGPGGQADDGAVRGAAAAAGAEEMIAELPEGYDTHLGRVFGEVNLSGGQWQRVALARALISPAPILVLDEPAASLDVHAESEMVETILRSFRDRTTIIISHRFGTIRRVDRIFVMEEGRLAEQGTHDELMRMDGLYSRLYSLHMRMAAGDDGAGASAGVPDVELREVKHAAVKP